MKSLVALGIVMIAVSNLFISAQSVNGQFYTNKKSELVTMPKSMEDNNLNDLSFYCQVTVNGFNVLEGIAKGSSIAEVERRLEKQYAEIFYDESNPPIVIVKCTLIQTKK